MKRSRRDFVRSVSSGAAFGVITAQVFGLRAGVLATLGLAAFAFAAEMLLLAL